MGVLVVLASCRASERIPQAEAGRAPAAASAPDRPDPRGELRAEDYANWSDYASALAVWASKNRERAKVRTIKVKQDEFGLWACGYIQLDDFYVVPFKASRVPADDDPGVQVAARRSPDPNRARVSVFFIQDLTKLCEQSGLPLGPPPDPS